MTPSASKLLAAVYSTVKNLEETYGPDDPAVLESKRILIECLTVVRVIESPEEARLFTSANQLAHEAASPAVLAELDDVPDDSLSELDVINVPIREGSD